MGRRMGEHYARVSLSYCSIYLRVTYREYEGGHATPVEVVREVFAWLTGKPFTPKG